MTYSSTYTANSGNMKRITNGLIKSSFSCVVNRTCAVFEPTSPSPLGRVRTSPGLTSPGIIEVGMGWYAVDGSMNAEKGGRRMKYVMGKKRGRI
jgi:hypothetical protein